MRVTHETAPISGSDSKRFDDKGGASGVSSDSLLGLHDGDPRGANPDKAVGNDLPPSFLDRHTDVNTNPTKPATDPTAIDTLVTPDRPSHKGRWIAVGAIAALALTGGALYRTLSTGGDPSTTDTHNQTGDSVPFDEQPDSDSNPDGIGAVQPNGSGNGGAGADAHNDPANVVGGDTVTIDNGPYGLIDVPVCSGDEKAPGWGKIPDGQLKSGVASVQNELTVDSSAVCSTEDGGVLLKIRVD